MAHKWDHTMDKKLMTEFIMYLNKGFQKFGRDKYADHVLYAAVRYITDSIGQCKGVKISEKAQENMISAKIKDHKKPAIQFYQEFRDKGEFFSESDAQRWFDQAEMVTITKEEDDALTEHGWRDKDRPPDAYEQLQIVVKENFVSANEISSRKDLEINSQEIKEAVPSVGTLGKHVLPNDLYKYITHPIVRDLFVKWINRVLDIDKRIRLTSSSAKLDWHLDLSDKRLVDINFRRDFFLVHIKCISPEVHFKIDSLENADVAYKKILERVK
ncbi:hypothetical protein LQZ19_07305 [Treponema primitia]|uniref:hypothetical protein n=1 Tax=Treponema primitia TaxID=88058 RepID=UPI00397F9437